MYLFAKKKKDLLNWFKREGPKNYNREEMSSKKIDRFEDIKNHFEFLKYYL